MEARGAMAQVPMGHGTGTKGALSRYQGDRDELHSRCVSSWLHLSVAQHRWSYLNVRWSPSVAENASSAHESREQPFCWTLRLVGSSADNQNPS